MLTRIESADNNRLKLVRKLRSKKARDESAQFVIEGINLVEEAVNNGASIRLLLAADGFSGNERLQAIIDSGKCAEICFMPDELLDRLAELDNGHGIGVIAVSDKPRYDGMLDFGADDNILVLDRVQDPGNIGTMIRTAVAAGYSAIVAVKGTADVWSPKVLRATAGMIFNIPFVYVNDADEMVRLVKASGKRIVVTVPVGGCPYYEENLKSGIALVIGNEGNGISDEVLKCADIGVTLPMKGDIESLNAAVSAAVLMYEAVRN